MRNSTIDYSVYKKPFKQRLSTFELDNGLHKERSSQLKFDKNLKIKRMMSKTGVGVAFSPGRNQKTELHLSIESNPPYVSDADRSPKDLDIAGKNLHAYEWKRNKVSGINY